MAEPIILGGENSLRFTVAWDVQSPEMLTGAEISRGHLTAHLAGRLVWGDATGAEPVGIHWSWIELLEHLANSWQRIHLEETDPLGISDSPNFLRMIAERRWRETSPHLRRDQEERFWSFETSHNLASGLGGISLPPLWVIRQGKEVLVSGGGVELLIPAGEVLATLEALGNKISCRIGLINDARARAAIENWNERDAISTKDAIEISTGLPFQYLKDAIGEPDVLRALELDDATEESELVALARMVGTAIPQNELGAILRKVRQEKKRDTFALDEISSQILADGAATAKSDEQVFQEGYRLAKRVRKYLVETELLASSVAAIDPEKILKKFGIRISTVAISALEFDAISFWGPRHGPAILVNSRGKHARSAVGARSTLAHELCHLLLDRTAALPLTEVLGGKVLRFLEQRANAFAAEFLLPTEAVIQAFAGGSARAAVQSLARSHRVSQEMVAWQARNHIPELSGKERAYLKTLVSDPASF